MLMFVMCLEEHKTNSVCLGEGIKVYQCVCVWGGCVCGNSVKETGFFMFTQNPLSCHKHCIYQGV